MKDRAFVDTNVLVYLYSEDEPEKQTTAIDAMERFHCLTSTQALNEFCSVCLRKLKMPSESLCLHRDKQQRNSIGFFKPFNYLYNLV
jgi:predicted nucleic acid-binding protein